VEKFRAIYFGILITLSYVRTLKHSSAAGSRETMRNTRASLASAIPAFHLKTICLLLIAAGLHVALTSAVLGVGKLQLFPAGVSTTGLSDALGRDSALLYQSEVESLTDLLNKGEVSAWFHRPADLHVKLYSLSFASFSRWTTFNVLTVEPLNLLYYLIILILIYRLARLVFDHRAGLFAMAIVGLWPSFLLHTTQLLRDPLLIIATLVLMLSTAQSLTMTLSWREAFLSALTSVIAVASIWCIRSNMWYMISLILVITIFLLILRQLRERRLLVVNLCCVLLVLGALALVPKALPLSRSRVTVDPVREPALWQRIAYTRRSAIRGNSLHPGSDIDTDVRFDGALDVIRYSPRAVIIGLFAPFPNMWFTPGQQVGWLGKLLAGFEMLLTYIIELLCVVGTWQRRKQLASWLLISTAVIGAGSIALMMVNVGSIYRLRYPFWMLLVVLGSGGLVGLLSKVSRGKESIAASVLAAADT
jgi:hypothetical protein